MTCHKEAVNEKASLDMLVESHTSSDEQTGIRTYSCIYCRYLIGCSLGTDQSQQSQSSDFGWLN